MCSNFPHYHLLTTAGGGGWTLMHNDYKQKCAQLSRNAQGLFSLCQFLGNEEVCFALVIIVHLIE